jgi:hypothetical protein
MWAGFCGDMAAPPLKLWRPPIPLTSSVPIGGPWARRGRCFEPISQTLGSDFSSLPAALPSRGILRVQEGAAVGF